MVSDRFEQLVTDTAQRFEENFQSPPRWIVAAPGRVNLIGEHVDYNDGFVLPMAVDRYCVIAACEKPGDDPGDTATFRSITKDGHIEITLDKPERGPAGTWWNYVAGVIAGCREAGLRPPKFWALAASDVPLGGGLSSSASIEVATATLIEAMTGTTLDPAAKALLCQQAEHKYAGVPCGIMDQFCSAMARADHLMLLDCRSREIEHVPFFDPTVTLLVINSNVQHELAGGEYAVRRGQCESAARKLGVATLRDATLDELESERGKLESVEYRRARHVIGEIDRTVAAARAVKAGDWPAVGRLMDASHDSLRDDFEVSCRELNLLVDLARDFGPEGGVFGSRMTGGGFGGSTVTLVRAADAQRVAHQVAGIYRQETSVEPSIWSSRPGRGAHVVKAG
jgi:galactokinase